MQNYEFNPDKNEFIANYQKLKSGKNMSEYYGVSVRKIYSYAQKINQVFHHLKINCDLLQ